MKQFNITKTVTFTRLKQNINAQLIAHSKEWANRCTLTSKQEKIMRMTFDDLLCTVWSADATWALKLTWLKNLSAQHNEHLSKNDWLLLFNIVSYFRKIEFREYYYSLGDDK